MLCLQAWAHKNHAEDEMGTTPSAPSIGDRQGDDPHQQEGSGLISGAAGTETEKEPALANVVRENETLAL